MGATSRSKSMAKARGVMASRKAIKTKRRAEIIVHRVRSGWDRITQLFETAKCGGWRRAGRATCTSSYDARSSHLRALRTVSCELNGRYRARTCDPQRVIRALGIRHTCHALAATHT